MSDQQPEAQRGPDLHHGNIAQFVCHSLNAKGILILSLDETGVTSLLGAGEIDHAQANVMLSQGIHMNLTAHDEKVLSGAAGEEAQEIAHRVLEANKELAL